MINEIELNESVETDYQTAETNAICRTSADEPAVSPSQFIVSHFICASCHVAD